VEHGITSSVPGNTGGTGTPLPYAEQAHFSVNSQPAFPLASLLLFINAAIGLRYMVEIIDCINHGDVDDFRKFYRVCVSERDAQ
jgi:hypothetical protein